LVAQGGDVHRALLFRAFDYREPVALSIQYQFGGFVHKQHSQKAKRGDNSAYPNSEATLNHAFAQ
jgi:hypothetical protein